MSGEVSPCVLGVEPHPGQGRVLDSDEERILKQVR